MVKWGQSVKRPSQVLASVHKHQRQKQRSTRATNDIMACPEMLILAKHRLPWGSSTHSFNLAPALLERERQRQRLTSATQMLRLLENRATWTFGTEPSKTPQYTSDCRWQTMPPAASSDCQSSALADEYQHQLEGLEKCPGVQTIQPCTPANRSQKYAHDH